MKLANPAPLGLFGFALLGLKDVLGIAVLGTLGGYGGLITAALAAYLAAAEVINEAHGKTLLPVGARV